MPAFDLNIQTDHQSKQYAPYKVEHKYIAMEIIITMHLYNSVQYCSRGVCGTDSFILEDAHAQLAIVFVQLAWRYSFWTNVLNIYRAHYVKKVQIFLRALTRAISRIRRYVFQKWLNSWANASICDDYSRPLQEYKSSPFSTFK